MSTITIQRNSDEVTSGVTEIRNFLRRKVTTIRIQRNYDGVTSATMIK